MGISALYLYLSPKLPPVETLREVKFQTQLRVYSADDRLMEVFGEKRRVPIAIADAPDLLIKAFLAAEDDRFYRHNGVSIRSILRAASQYLLRDGTPTGGSTITMQVAKNFFLENDRSLVYKAKQVFLAYKIEWELEKDEILELYINKIPFGNRAYGAAAAAQVYYGKSLNELSLAQFAMIAGMPQRPSDSNPIANPERALNRRNWILRRMLNLGYIDQAAYTSALGEPVSASYNPPDIELYAPYISEMARRHMYGLYGEDAYTEGYRVYTTVDSKLQDTAQRAVINGLQSYDERHGYRGPEQRLEVFLIEDPTNLDEETQLYTLTTVLPADKEALEAGDDQPLETTPPPLKQIDIAPWLTQLKSIPSYAGLRPAAVLRAQGQELDALLSNGEIIQIPWENGPNSARPHINADRRGPRPQDTTFLKLGDVIRVQFNRKGWNLTQVPDAQAAFVAINPDNGSIRALVGGLDFSQSNFNRAFDAKRQPGSNFKPFIYAAALENGKTAASRINDSPYSLFDSSLEGYWRPNNAGDKYLGEISLREGLYRSKNMVAIRLLEQLVEQVGYRAALSNMDRFGFNKNELPRDLSLALGSHALTPLEIARGYTVFANGGYKIEPFYIDRIENNNGEVIYQSLPITVCRNCEEAAKSEGDFATVSETPPLDDAAAVEAQLQELFANERDIVEEVDEAPPLPSAERVMSPQIAFLIDDLLQDVIKRGTGTDARVLRRNDLAGKTGTIGNSDANSDAWFSGYHPSLVATAWVGFDQSNKSLGRNEYGAKAALPIWIDFMQVALQDVPEAKRTVPNGMIQVNINAKTGKRAQPNDPNAVLEWFRKENIPELDIQTTITNPVQGEEALHPDDLF